MAVSMGDVAQHAGVSQRTVSNVVNGYVHVAPATRARVEASLVALGYRPNAAARQLRSGRTGSITLAVPGLGERYFADFADAVIRRAADQGLRVLIETTAGKHDAELALIRGGSGLLTDGLIMAAISLRADDHVVIPAVYPMVIVGDRETAGWVDHVGFPNREAVRAAVRHLIALGRRRIAVVGADPGAAGTPTTELRLQGYRDALHEAGISFDPALVVPAEWTRDDGERVANAMVDGELVMPDGIFAMNDSTGLGLLRGFARRGIDVPSRVAVIGFDNIAESRYSTPSLSSVAPALDQIASTALAMIAEQLADSDSGRSPQQRHIDFDIIVRESTGG